MKLEQKEIISQQQREFTNKELLEIVNDTEEGRAILEREKLRIQAEMAKVESMESIPELQQIGRRVISFSNLKKPHDMKKGMLTLSIADSEGKVLEGQDCCVIETLFEDGVYKTSCPETFFALKRKDIPRKSAFILELKHYKEMSVKFPTKCAFAGDCPRTFKFRLERRRKANGHAHARHTRDKTKTRCGERIHFEDENWRENSS